MDSNKQTLTLTPYLQMVACVQGSRNRHVSACLGAARHSGVDVCVDVSASDVVVKRRESVVMFRPQKWCSWGCQTELSI